jgi:sugar phosphate isomerase/epimerase
MKTNRKDFIMRSLFATTGLSSGMNLHAIAQNEELIHGQIIPSTGLTGSEAYKISIFSKNLQWLGYEEMAKVAAQIGFDGVDITVRPGGHVAPEKVAEDLPKAVAAVRSAGLNVYMITTGIERASEPHTESILKTASSLGIHHYRMNWVDYAKEKTIEENLVLIEKQFRELEVLNKKYSIYGEYQNHSGTNFGAPIWDLYTVLKNINSPWIGAQYDIFHATVEAANSWPIGLKLLSPYIMSMDIKDFLWAKKDDKWIPNVVPLGEGCVDFKSYLNLVKQLSIKVPVSIHYEYPLGGAEHGARSITIKREDVIAAMKRDCDILKSFFKSANLQ